MANTTTTNKKPTNKKHKPAPKEQRIETAFRKATQGRLCPICNKRYISAVYQRHFDRCKLPEENDEVIYCGEKMGTPTKTKQNLLVKKERPSSTLREAIEITKKVYKNESKKGKGNPANQSQSRFSTLSTIEFLEDLEALYSENSAENNQPPPPQEQITKKRSNSNDNIISETVPKKKSNLNGILLSEIYEKCLKQLNKFLQDRGEIRQPLKNIELSASQNSNDGCGIDGIDQSDKNDSPNEFDNVHYSLRFIWKILKNVLLCPEHENFPEVAQKFWGQNALRLMLAFLNVSVKSQHLFSRLLIRRWDWLTPREINKYSELSSDLMPFLIELRENELLEDAFNSGTIKIEAAIRLMNLEELKPICKKLLKIDTGIGHKAIRERLEKYAEQKNVLGGSNKENLLNSIKSQIGECFRINKNALDLFMSFFTIYSPNLMDTAQLIGKYQSSQGPLTNRLIFTMLQHQQGEIAFMGPACLPHSILRIYSTLDELMDYINAKNWEQKLRKMIDGSKFKEAWECAQKQKMEFIDQFLEGENPKILRYMELPIYLRKFTPPWVHCRCIFHGIEAAQRIRQYSLAVKWIKFLLEKEEFKHFCVNSRGIWYHRLALNFSHHLKEKREAIKTCILGIQDPLVKEKDKLELQNRLDKMSKNWNNPAAQITPIVLNEPEKVQIVGKTIGKGLGIGVRVNHFYLPSTSTPPSSTFASTPPAQREEINNCPVELVALNHFLENEGFTEGVHCESAIWHCLFRLFFADIIFCPHLEDVWISPMQEDPLDLNYTDFYENRRSQIDARLNQILSTTGSIEHCVHLHSDRIKYNQKKGASNSQIGWHRFENDEQLLSLLRCCSPQFLHDLFKRLCTDYRGTRSGFPDLTVWNSETKKLAVVEVKGPNDQLSSKQQLWLHFFQSRGVRAILCNVSAKNDRALD